MKNFKLKVLLLFLATASISLFGQERVYEHGSVVNVGQSLVENNVLIIPKGYNGVLAPSGNVFETGIIAKSVFTIGGVQDAYSLFVGISDQPEADISTERSLNLRGLEGISLSTGWDGSIDLGDEKIVLDVGTGGGGVGINNTDPAD